MDDNNSGDFCVIFCFRKITKIKIFHIHSYMYTIVVYQKVAVFEI